MEENWWCGSWRWIRIQVNRTLEDRSLSGALVEDGSPRREAENEYQWTERGPAVEGGRPRGKQRMRMSGQRGNIS